MSDTITTDVAVIGAGPGGYVAALRAAQLGKKVVLVERDKVGGTCLNYGCIPSKCLLDDTKLYALTSSFEERGIKLKGAEIDYAVTVARKDKVVKQLVSGIEFLLKKAGVQTVTGTAVFKNHKEIVVEGRDGKVSVKAQDFIVATGSEPINLPGLTIDGKKIITSKEALDLKTPPKKLLVVGGGAIGLEMGTIFRRVGSDVIIVELMPNVLPGTDKDIVKIVSDQLRRQGFKVCTSSKVESIKQMKEGIKVKVASAKDSVEVGTFDVNLVLVSVGRRAAIGELGLKEIGVHIDDRGFVKADNQLKTNLPGIYAIGDAIGGKLLAHKASHEGIVAAEVIAGKNSVMDHVIPGAVFCEPEVATVGLTEDEALEKGFKVKTGQFPFRASGKAQCLAEREGIVKVVGNAETDDLLGVHIVGPHASDLIAEATLALEMEATVEDFQSSVRIHPALSEAVMEAALATDKRAIHFAN